MYRKLKNGQKSKTELRQDGEVCKSVEYLVSATVEKILTDYQ